VLRRSPTNINSAAHRAKEGTPPMNAGALEGIRVLEFASYVSGPFAGMLLSDLGAEVVKVESPDGGDPFRNWGKQDYNGTFGSMNRNKKSVTLDLKTEAGRASARRLALGADVIIENFRSGVMERLGLGYEALAADNPRLVYCSITGFGSDGPYRSRPGYDTVGQAVSGLLSVLTDRKAPQPMGVSLSDHLAGTFAAYGVLAALMARTTSGRGQKVETSLLQATLAFLGENAATFFEDGRVPSRATRCQRAQVFAFTAGDGLPFVVHLSSPEKFWRGLLAVTGREALGADERFRTREMRVKNYDALYAELTAAFQTRPRADWLRLLEAKDVPSGPINTIDEVFTDPQVVALDMRKDLPHRARGTVSVVGNPVRLSATPPRVETAAPDLGAHNDAFLRE
jgi:crotonobetainyl-CoA:carnitine CoA-transferase CaiB-like acyl-CoA transferase